MTAENSAPKADFQRLSTRSTGAWSDSRAVPAVEHLRRSLDEQLQLARRGQKAAALHQLADLVRFRHGVDLPSAEEARTLIQNIIAIWKERDVLLGPTPESLDPTTEQDIRTDLLDLAIACVELRLGLAPPAEAAAARRDALRLHRPGERCVRTEPETRSPATSNGRQVRRCRFARRRG